MKTKAERIEIIERSRVRVREHGTTDAYARNADGEETGATEPDAVCWCALGALRVEFEADTEHRLMCELGFMYSEDKAEELLTEIVQANDGGGSIDAAFDRLIAALPEDPEFP
jgi:hypothetical protein